MIAVARTCNLIFIVLDVLKPLKDLAILTNELEGFGIRLNKKPPAITVRKKESGGVSYQSVKYTLTDLRSLSPIPYPLQKSMLKKSKLYFPSTR